MESVIVHTVVTIKWQQDSKMIDGEGGGVFLRHISSIYILKKTIIVGIVWI